MRKALCALLSGVLALSLCACGQPVEDITVTGEFRSYQDQDGIAIGWSMRCCLNCASGHS